MNIMQLKKSNNMLQNLRDELNQSKIEIDKKQHIINNLMQLNRENVETKRNYIRFYNQMYDKILLFFLGKYFFSKVLRLTPKLQGRSNFSMRIRFWGQLLKS